MNKGCPSRIIDESEPCPRNSERRRQPVPGQLGRAVPTGKKSPSSAHSKGPKTEDRQGLRQARKAQGNIRVQTAEEIQYQRYARPLLREKLVQSQEVL